MLISHPGLESHPTENLPIVTVIAITALLIMDTDTVVGIMATATSMAANAVVTAVLPGRRIETNNQKQLCAQ